MQTCSALIDEQSGNHVCAAVANQAGAVQALLTAIGTASTDHAAVCNSLDVLKRLLEADSGKEAFAAASGAPQLKSVLKSASAAPGWGMYADCDIMFLCGFLSDAHSTCVCCVTACAAHACIVAL